jgi:hypothetical protein
LKELIMQTVKRSNSFSAKADIKKARKLRKVLSPRRFSLLGTVKIGGRWMANISTGHSDFHDPFEALRQQLADEADVTKQPSPVRHLDLTEVSTSTPQPSKPRSHHLMQFKSFYKRMSGRCEKIVRMWRTQKPLPYGYFFLYRDSVLLVTWTQKGGFQHSVVPEDGLNLIAK